MSKSAQPHTGPVNAVVPDAVTVVPTNEPTMDKCESIQAMMQRSRSETRVRLLANICAATKLSSHPVEREKTSTAFKMPVQKNEKFNMAAYLASVRSGTAHKLPRLPIVYIGLLQHGNIKLEDLAEASERNSSAASDHTSAEGQTKVPESVWEKNPGGSLDDPSSLVYRLAHR